MFFLGEGNTYQLLHIPIPLLMKRPLIIDENENDRHDRSIKLRIRKCIESYSQNPVNLFNKMGSIYYRVDMNHVIYLDCITKIGVRSSSSSSSSSSYILANTLCQFVIIYNDVNTDEDDLDRSECMEHFPSYDLCETCYYGRVNGRVYYIYEDDEGMDFLSVGLIV